MKGFKKPFSLAVAVGAVANIVLARWISCSQSVNVEVLKTMPSSSQITILYTGILGETAPFADFYKCIRGDVIAPNCDVFDYDASEIAYLPDLDAWLDGKQEINIVGISMGAVAATKTAKFLQAFFPDRQVRLYLLDPCMGSDQIKLVKMPGSVMRGLSNIITLTTYALGGLSFVPIARGHSLANIQGEIATSVQRVESFSKQLLPITKVVVSNQDWLVDSAQTSEYFRGCAEVDFIDASHADFTADHDAWLAVLEKQGLFN